MSNLFDPFSYGELMMHHRRQQGMPISCGAPSGCVTAVIEDVRCPACLRRLAAVTAEQAERRGGAGRG